MNRRCLKWVHMTHLDIWNTSYGQKKGRESNWQFDSRPLKAGNRPKFLACRWRATYRWKAVDEGSNFALDLITIEGLHTKLSGPKVVGVPTLGISGLPFWSLETKCHLDVAPVERHKTYFKGEGGGFPQVWAVVSLVNLNLPMVCLSIKSVETMHWPMCCLVCIDLSEWISCLSSFLVPSWNSGTPLYLRNATS